jgi:hypothetical protein
MLLYDPDVLPRELLSPWLSDVLRGRALLR